MKTLQVLMEATHVIERLNCADCQWSKGQKTEPLDASDANEQGGMKCPGGEASARAKKGKLITLPGNAHSTSKTWCSNPKIDQWVTGRMWCKAWEAPGTLRSFEDDSK